MSLLFLKFKKLEKRSRLPWNTGKHFFIIEGIVVLIFLLLMSLTSALAGEWHLIGSMGAKEEYNDNLFFDESSEVDDFVTTLSPGLELSKITERAKLSLNGRLDHRIYASESDLNDTDQQYLGSVQYAVTPRLNLSGSAEYRRDSSPDRDIETTGLVLGTNTRHTQRYSAAGNYVFSEKMTGTISYDYTKDKYKSESDSDSETNSVNLLLSRDIGLISNAQGRLILAYNRYHYSESDVDSYEMMVGFSKALSETWSFVADAGASYSRTDFVTLDKKDSNWGFVGNTTLSWSGEKTSVNFTLSHDVSSASNLGSATNRTSLSFSVNRRFTLDLSGYIAGGYYRNKSDRNQYSTTEIDEESFYGRAGMKYTIINDLFIDTAYTYNRVDYRVTNETADRNLFMIQLCYQHDFLQ